MKQIVKIAAAVIALAVVAQAPVEAKNWTKYLRGGRALVNRAPAMPLWELNQRAYGELGWELGRNSVINDPNLGPEFDPGRYPGPYWYQFNQ
jgi:hypothetical protein